MVRKLRISVAFLLFLSSVADSSIMLESNGYRDILVGISEDIPQPTDDNGVSFIQDIKALFTETSAALYQATNQRVFFKEINILLPRSWENSIAGTAITNTRDLTYKDADIRLLPADPVSGNMLPFTFHSGKCGVAGDHIEVPVDYLNSTLFTEEIKVKAKAIVQEWSKFRYGVFEEHGYSGDGVLSYFYRHPDGYDALSSSNDTEIQGTLQQRDNEANCQVTAGVIADKDNCHFVPSSTGQTAKSSVMSFYWVESVVGFSEVGKYNVLAPHRQNRLCNVKSSWEIISTSEDIMISPPAPGANTIPNFKVWRNSMEPLLYIAVDTSYHSQGNFLGLIKRELVNLINSLKVSNPDAYIGFATFQGEDKSPSGYVREIVAPIRVAEGSSQLTDAINAMAFADISVSNRNIPAVFREVLPKLTLRSDLGGSYLYIATQTDSEGTDDLLELDVSQQLIRNNVKLFAVETGQGRLTLARLGALSDGYYLFGATAGSTYPFPQMSTEIKKTFTSILNVDRAVVFDSYITLEVGKPTTGTFLIDESADLNTTAVLQSPRDGKFTVTLEGPLKQQLTLNNQGANDTNWFLTNSTVGVSWLNLTDTGAVAGEWSYSISYDKSSCDLCPDKVDVLFQVSTSRNPQRVAYLPKINYWLSVQAGSNTVDVSKSPLIISARFDTPDGRVGGLDVKAEIIDESNNLKSIVLYDIGSVGSDIARDGIYSGIFIPDNDGTHTISIMASQSAQSRSQNRLMDQNQGSSCCGTSVPTKTVTNFQRTNNKAMVFDVTNANSGAQKLPSSVVNDLTFSTYGVDDGKVIINMMWTVAPYTTSQKVKYSESFEDIINEIENAPEATLVYGNIPSNEGVFVNIYVSAPYQANKNIYFAVQTTTSDTKTVSSNVVWTDKNPPDAPFTTPDGSSPTTTLSTTTTTSSTVTTTTEPITTTMSSSTTPTTTDLTTTTTTSSSTTTISPTTTSLTTTVSTTPEAVTTDSTTNTSPQSSTLASTEIISTKSTDSTTLSTTESTTLSTTESTTFSTTESTTFSTTESTTFSTTESTTLSSTESTTLSTIESTIFTTTDITTDLTTSTSVANSTSTTTTTDSTTASPTTTASTTTTTDSTTASQTTLTETSTTPDTTTTTYTSTTHNSETSPTTTTITETSETTESTTENPDKGDGLTGAEIGYIVGAAVGGLIIGAIAIGLILYFKSKASAASTFASVTQPPPPPSSGYSQQSTAYQPAPRSAPSAVLPSSYGSYGTVDEDIPARFTQSASKPRADPYRQQFVEQSSGPRKRRDSPPSYDNFGITVEDDDSMLTAL